MPNILLLCLNNKMSSEAIVFLLLISEFLFLTKNLESWLCVTTTI